MNENWYWAWEWESEAERANFLKYFGMTFNAFNR